MVITDRMKRMLVCLCAFVCLFLSAAALADSAPMVVDECGLFTSSEIREMETIIQKIRQDYQLDAVVLTTRNAPLDHSSDMMKAQRYADRYYDEHGYGLGEDSAGLLYMIDMNNRVPFISTKGVMVDYINDSRLDKLFDVSDPLLREGRYGDAAITLLNRLQKYCAQGIEEGQFRYDTATGQRLTGLYNKLTMGELLVALLVGAAAAASVAGIVASRYQLKGTTYRYDRQQNTSLRLSRDDRTLVSRDVRRVRNVSSDSHGGGGGGGGHGSGVHSGGHGGGHGGRF